MSIIGSTVLVGSTGATYAGGTGRTWTLTGQDVNGGINVAMVDDVDYRTRRNASFKSRTPQVRNGTYGLAFAEAIYAVPILLDTDGSVVFNTLRLTLRSHPSVSEATRKDMLMVGAQVLTDTDYANFWQFGALS